MSKQTNKHPDSQALRWRVHKRTSFEKPKPASISIMSSLIKIINVRQLEADVLDESSASDDVDLAKDTSSVLPEVTEETVRAVPEELSTDTGDPQETAPGVSVAPTQTSEVRVERMKLTPQQQAVIDEGVVGKSWQRRSQRAKTQKIRNRQSRMAAKAKPRRETVDTMPLMEPWMLERDPEESTDAYLTRLVERGKTSSDLFVKIMNKINKI